MRLCRTPSESPDGRDGPGTEWDDLVVPEPIQRGLTTYAVTLVHAGQGLPRVEIGAYRLPGPRGHD